MYNTHRRLGKFVIPVELIKNKPAFVFTVMSTVIPVRAEQRFDIDAIEYVGICHNFDMVKLGEIAPEYRALVENGFVRWQKILID